MEKDQIIAPITEIDTAAEWFCNEISVAAVAYEGNAYRQVKIMQDLIARLFNTAYRSGYSQRVLEESINSNNNA